MPPFCEHKIKPVARFKANDIWDPETLTVIPGPTFTTWQTCGLRPGHAGEHGGYQPFGRIRLRIANWLAP